MTQTLRTQPTAMARPADYDATRTTHAAGFPRSTTYRLRIWRQERLVVVTEIAANQGASVTNAIESVAHDAEVVLRSAGFAEPRTLPFDAGWALCEHYERTTRPDTFDRVEFEPRAEFYDGALRHPTWSPWRETQNVDGEA